MFNTTFPGASFIILLAIYCHPLPLVLLITRKSQQYLIQRVYLQRIVSLVVLTHRQKIASLPSRYNPFGPHRPGNSTMATPRAPDKQIRLPSLDGRIRVTLKDKLGFVPICLVVLLAEEEDRMSFWKGTGNFVYFRVVIGKY